MAREELRPDFLRRGCSSAECVSIGQHSNNIVRLLWCYGPQVKVYSVGSRPQKTRVARPAARTQAQKLQPILSQHTRTHKAKTRRLIPGVDIVPRASWIDPQLNQLALVGIQPTHVFVKI